VNICEHKQFDQEHVVHPPICSLGSYPKLFSNVDMSNVHVQGRSVQRDSSSSLPGHVACPGRGAGESQFLEMRAMCGCNTGISTQFWWVLLQNLLKSSFSFGVRKTQKENPNKIYLNNIC